MIVHNPTNIELVNIIIELLNNFFDLFCNVLPLLVTLCIKKNMQKKDKNN